MLNWQIESLKLELKYTWKISRNVSDFKLNFIVKVSDKIFEGKGEVAPNVRYNETPETIQNGFQKFLESNHGEIFDLNSLTKILDPLNLQNALRFGIESAFIHFLCKKENKSVNDFLRIQKPEFVQTSFSLPIMETGEVKKFYRENNLQRFKRLKIKVNKENAFELVKEISSLTQQPIIIDGNETWQNPDEVLNFMASIKKFNIVLMEQPLPSSMIDGYKFLKPLSPFLLFADESICAHADFDELKKQFHGINMKLMKAGGYFNGLHLLNEARKHHLKTMIGCMVETSLGISSAMHLCSLADFVDLDGFLIVKNEPFNFVKEVNGHLSLVNSQ